jgi:hypothetical protein
MISRQRILAACAAGAVALSLAVTQAVGDPKRWSHEWPRTDFSRSSVPFDKILSGGPPKDGIPALSDPKFQSASADRELSPRDPVITLEIAGAEPRAYPLRYLTWHEIVNDRVGGVPVAVTFCPLCNSALVFDRRVKGELRSFGVSGKLRHSDMIMYDRETESWWQQAVGEAIVGRHLGDRLTLIPSWTESWERFRARNPEGLVMARPGAARAYGRNPYTGYDSSARPFLYRGEMPPHGIQPLARVVKVGARAWPLSRLRETPVIEEAGLRLSWQPGQASALDSAQIASGRQIGDVRVRDGQGRDVAHDVMFAFAFHAFHPDGTWMLGR